MGVASEALAAIPGEDLVKFAPLLLAVIKGTMDHDGEEKIALSMDSISRGLQYAKETGDTSQLTAAIDAHIGASGIRVP